MQQQFEIELEKLRNKVVKMGNLSLHQTSAAISILLHGNFEELEATEKIEHKIDKLDVKVDKLCQRIFALKQPVAKDLRFIMSSLRIGTELERIGDIAMSIVNKSEAVREQPEILKELHFENVITTAHFLIQEAFSQYSIYDQDKILKILKDCVSLKEKCHNLLDVIISEMTTKSEIIIVATNLIIILRQVERLADHASNIAESIYFMQEGTIIKHSRLKDKTNSNSTFTEESE